jgi:ubiquinol-cytochrome c reductase cytochrome b subunit
MNAILSWLDDRTGLVSACQKSCDRSMPGGSGVRYVLPSALAFTFVVEAITGVLLWMFYSAGAQSSWESVYWIQEKVLGGWLLRGIHFYAGNLMVVLALLWLLELVVGRFYRAPGEFVFWVALAIFGCLLGLLLTGDLLRWDQEGVTSTEVRTRFLLLLPVVGSNLFKLAVGGNAFGHLTATRFLALHAGVLGAILAALLAWNCRLLGRHGLVCSCCKAESSTGKPYWPNQSVLNTTGWLLVMVAVGLLIARTGWHGHHAGQPAGQYLGAPLGAPAAPGSAYSAARPEWAFWALYEFAHMFPGEWAVVPIFIVPSILALFAFLMPFIGRHWLGHVFNLLVVAGLLAVAVLLSRNLLRADRHDPGFQAALAEGEQEAARVKQLVRAGGGVPITGARTLLAEDPKTQGPKLFAQYCASCHSLTDEKGQGIQAEKPTAPNLYRYASREWIAGLLDPKRIVGPERFGNTAFKNAEMVGFVKDNFAEMEADDKKKLEKTVIALSAEAGLPYQQQADAPAAATIKEGRELMLKDYRCVDCHKFYDTGTTGKGCPELTGYGSRAWIVGIISNPAHPHYYAKKNDRMPVYAEFPTEPAKNQLSPKSIEILADFLRHDWYEPAGDEGR